MSEAQSTGDSESSRPRNTAVAVALLPFLGVLGLGLGVVLGARGHEIPILGLAILTSLLALVPLCVDLLRPLDRRHLLLSLFSLTFIVFFGLPVLTIYLPADWPVRPLSSTEVFPRDVVRTQVVAALALAALLLGYALPFGRMAASLFPTPRHDWPLETSLLVAATMIPFGWAVNLSSIYGFLPAALGTGVLGALSLGIWFGLALLWLAYLRHGSRVAVRLIGLLIGPTMFVFFFSGSKGRFLLPIALLVLTSWLYRRRIRVRWILAGILGVSLLYPAAQSYRELARGRSMAQMLRNPLAVVLAIGERISSYTPSEYLTAGLGMLSTRYDGLGRSSVIVTETPDRVPFQGGWTIAQIPLGYVPRVLWPGKPEIGIGQWITDTYGPGPHIRSATGPTWIGEFYLNWGVPGVTGGMLTIGLLLRLLHEGLLRSRTTPALLAGVVVLFQTVSTSQGALVPSVNGVTFTLAPLFAMHVLLRLFGMTRIYENDAPETVEVGSEPSRPLGDQPC